jgi:hypothetical protein
VFVLQTENKKKLTQIEKEMKIENMKEMMVCLTEVELTESPVITCSVNLNQTHLKATEEMEQQAAEVSRGLDGIQKSCFDEALSMMQKFLLDTPMPNAKGAVLYARVGELPFMYVFPVGIELETSLVVDELPHIYPIVETCDTYHRFVVVTLTSREARIFETTAGAVTSEILTERPELREKIGREWTRERYHNHKQDRKQRFIQSKISVLEELMTKAGHKSLIVAGSPKMVSSFTNALPARLREMLVDTLDVNPKAGMDPILLEAINSFVEKECAESHDQVDALESALMKQGLGVAGEDAARQALEHGYADVLVIDQDYNDLARESLVRLAIQCDADIETVKGSKKLKRLDGVGCLLRYRPAYVNQPRMSAAS